MSVIQTKNSFSLILSQQELWYLAKSLGPGIIYGVSDPTIDFTENEVVTYDTMARNSLIASGFAIPDELNHLQIDELIGMMVYSCMNSNHLLVTKNPSSGQESFFHFLPEWQLELKKQGDQYVLTLLKESGDIFPYLISSSKIPLTDSVTQFEFEVSERDLEIALFLYGAGKQEQAINSLLESSKCVNLDCDEFLRHYIRPDLHLYFDMIYHKKNKKLIFSNQVQLIQSTIFTLWVTRYFHGDEGHWKLNFKSLTVEDVFQHFIEMLPRN